MKCYFCQKEACAKLGTAKGNLWKGLWGGKVWDKTEVYVCQEHYDLHNVNELEKHRFKIGCCKY